MSLFQMARLEVRSHRRLLSPRLQGERAGAREVPARFVGAPQSDQRDGRAHVISLGLGS